MNTHYSIPLTMLTNGLTMHYVLYYTQLSKARRGTLTLYYVDGRFF